MKPEQNFVLYKEEEEKYKNMMKLCKFDFKKMK